MAAALASLALTVTAHSLLICTTFFLPKATYICLKVTVGFYDPIKKKNGRTDRQTDGQTDRLKVYELVPLPKVGNPG